jgi:hypothetical protein
MTMNAVGQRTLVAICDHASQSLERVGGLLHTLGLLAGSTAEDDHSALLLSRLAQRQLEEARRDLRVLSERLRGGMQEPAGRPHDGEGAHPAALQEDER